MAEGKNLKATSIAADAIGSVITYDAGAPSNTEMSQVSGVKEGPAAEYALKLASIGGNLEAQFTKRIAAIQADLKSSKFSIEQMQSVDEDIAVMLRGLDSGSASAEGSASDPQKQWG
ncbi:MULTISPECIES: hypothetical protein [unclassified Leucobacter]|uniref:hypothetical protein n=1 Tax=unclassified Leucobacter TaxID=2621730 RepID=UPI00165D6ED7|nr:MULTISPECIES: hypothetical protein [unclassified Leucobacter]MBC9927486.1 hypothetical protein [Leucobacter sp. cx-169]